MKGQKFVKIIFGVFVVSFICCIVSQTYYSNIIDSNQVLSNLNRTESFLEAAQRYNSDNSELYTTILKEAQEDLKSICEVSSDKSCESFFILYNQENTSK